LSFHKVRAATVEGSEKDEEEQKMNIEQMYGQKNVWKRRKTMNNDEQQRE